MAAIAPNAKSGVSANISTFWRMATFSIVRSILSSSPIKVGASQACKAESFTPRGLKGLRAAFKCVDRSSCNLSDQRIRVI